MNVEVTISSKNFEGHVKNRKPHQRAFVWFSLRNNFVDWPEWHMKPHYFMAAYLLIVGIASEANDSRISISTEHSAHRLRISDENFIECLKFFEENRIISIAKDVGGGYRTIYGTIQDSNESDIGRLHTIHTYNTYNTIHTIQHTGTDNRSPESANLKTESPSDVSQGAALHPQTSSRLITGNSSTTAGKKLRPLVGTSYEAFFDHYHQKGQEFTEGFLSKEYKKIEKYYQDKNIPLTINLIKRWMSSEITLGAWEKYLKSDAYTIEMIQCMALVEQENRDKGGQNV